MLPEALIRAERTVLGAFALYEPHRAPGLLRGPFTLWRGFTLSPWDHQDLVVGVGGVGDVDALAPLALRREAYRVDLHNHAIARRASRGVRLWDICFAGGEGGNRAVPPADLGCRVAQALLEGGPQLAPLEALTQIVVSFDGDVFVDG